jgi:hypothetical protein
MNRTVALLAAMLALAFQAVRYGRWRREEFPMAERWPPQGTWYFGVSRTVICTAIQRTKGKTCGHSLRELRLRVCRSRTALMVGNT